MGCANKKSIQVQEETTLQKKKTGLKQLNFAFFVKENKNQLLHNYVIKNKIGEGAYGVVKRVIDKSNQEERALKIIYVKSKEKNQQERLEKEILILKQLDHPSILKVYEFFQDKRHFYIVTELIKGGELFEKIVELSTFEEDDAAYIFRQLISVIQYCHDKNIIHRDLKPENILLEYNPKQKDQKYEIKVIDWGASIETQQQDECLQEIVGTNFYIAPEVLLKKYTNKCDIWSAGIILYILLCGETPFQGKDKEIYKKILSLQFSMDQDIWQNISDEAKDLIKKMICPEKQRLTAKEVQEHPWLKKYGVNNNKENKKIIDLKAKSFVKLKKFNTSNKLQQAVLIYISNQLMTKEETKDLKELFHQIDKNNDGVLTKDEIKNGFNELQDILKGDYNVDQIFNQVDIDGNGKINYSEFITVCIKNEQMLQNQKLEKAFQIFDTDANGYITVDELREIFDDPASKNTDMGEQIIKKCDKDNDGKINFQEFQKMMESYAQQQ